MTSIEAIELRTLEDNQQLLRRYRRERHLSFSAASTFLRCPRQYRYRYVEARDAEFISDDLVFGIAFHKVAASFYSWNRQKGEALPPDKLCADFVAILDAEIARAWVPIKYKRTRDELVELGQRMLKVFGEGIKPRRVIAAEVPFSVPIHDPVNGEVIPAKLVGSIDLLEADDAGNIVVSELKTSGKKWSDRDVDQNLQASLYSWVVRELGLNDGRDVLVRFDVVTKTKSPALQQLYATRTEADQRRAVRLLCDVYRSAEARCFHINPSWACSTCAYQSACNADG